jgi:hypothetical protein
MKIDRVLSITAVLISLLAILDSVLNADARADAALRRRETEICKAAAPKFARFYTDMAGESFDAASFKPTRLEELFAPYGSVMSKVLGTQP